MPKPRARLIAPAILQRARDFRHPLTAPEAKVWHGVRNRQLGFKFRRQRPIGRFIVDFWCAEAKLVIEIDGDTHAAPDQAAYDSARTAWLEERGYKVIRFQAGEVDRNLEGVLEAIRRACEARTAGGREEGRG
jgi:very-short-patch-repair endonuclease